MLRARRMMGDNAMRGGRGMMRWRWLGGGGEAASPPPGASRISAGTVCAVALVSLMSIAYLRSTCLSASAAPAPS
eukprot:3863763-Pyramimonas_sp.AAC.1